MNKKLIAVLIACAVLVSLVLSSSLSAVSEATNREVVEDRMADQVSDQIIDVIGGGWHIADETILKNTYHADKAITVTGKHAWSIHDEYLVIHILEDGSIVYHGTGYEEKLNRTDWALIPVRDNNVAIMRK